MLTMTPAHGRYSVALVAAIIAAAAVAPGRGAAAVQTQRDMRQRHVVVSVTDKNDKPVTGLTEKDFVLREDGVAREILSALPAPAATHLVLLVDDSQATQSLTIELRAGLKAFLRQVMADGRGTAVRVATFGDRPTTRVEFTTSRAALDPAVDRIVPRPGAGATLLEAIVETCKDLRTRGAGRPVIVAFVEEHGPEFSSERYTQVADALKAAHATLWAVVLQAPGGQDASDEVRERTRVLTDVTVESGGYAKTFLSKQGIEPAFATVGTALTTQYDLVYARPDALIPPSKLDIQARDKALRVIAPRWTGQ